MLCALSFHEKDDMRMLWWFSVIQLSIRSFLSLLLNMRLLPESFIETGISYHSLVAWYTREFWVCINLYLGKWGSPECRVL